MFCSNCGCEIKEGKFCPECGTLCENTSESMNLEKENINTEKNVIGVPTGNSTNARSKTSEIIGRVITGSLVTIAVIATACAFFGVFDKNPWPFLIFIFVVMFFGWLEEKFPKIPIIVIAILEVVALVACFVIGSGKATSIIQSQDEHVLAVKGGHPNSYPDKTYGEAFENFFKSPTWKYFKGTQNGPDEDGDGKPDYTNDDIDVVEFTGYCTYSDVEVKALIQFTLDLDNDSFDATYLSFNDVPQDLFVLGSLIEAAFEDDTTSNKDNNITSDQNNNTTSSEDSNVTAEENETDNSGQEGNAIESIDYDYAGEYVSLGGNMQLYLDVYEKADTDGSIGNMFMYEGENLMYDTPYFVSDKEPDDFEGAYIRTYVFYNQGYPYYLGVTIQNGNEIWLDYDSENRIIDYFQKV